MTQQEIINQNEKFAKFLGWEKYEDVNERFYGNWKPNTTLEKPWSVRVEVLQFHTDWNWIMEVIKDIENLYNGAVIVEITDKSCNISIYKFLYKKYTTMNTKIEAVTQAINQFLIWHEQNK